MARSPVSTAQAAWNAQRCQRRYHGIVTVIPPLCCLPELADQQGPSSPVPATATDIGATVPGLRHPGPSSQRTHETD